jgi:RNA polymerase sigma-70 factor (ECF subfamily)
VAIDASGIEACYVRVRRGLFNVLYRMLWDAPACQDIIQEAFVRLWSRRASLHAEHLDALAYHAALNLARNSLRWKKLRHWVGVDALDERALPADLAEDRRAELCDLRDALARLEQRDREIVLLSEYAGFDTAELARLLGVAPGTIGSRKHRALARLRELLKEPTGE